MNHYKKWLPKWAAFMVLMIIFFNLLPLMAIAASPITPGKPITPGNPITPGQPINPGNPITPGDPIKPGDPITPGSPINPGDPITPGNPIIPGNPITPGDAITPPGSGGSHDPNNPSNPGNSGGGGNGGPGDPANPGGPGNHNGPTPGDGLYPGGPAGPGGSTPGNAYDPSHPNNPGSGGPGDGYRGDDYKDNVKDFGNLLKYRNTLNTLGQGILSYKYGFRLNNTATGNISVSGLNSFENQPKTDFERKLMNDYKGDIRRNWYAPDQNKTIRKFTQPGYAVKQSLLDSYNPANKNFWKLSNNIKGGGVLGLGLTTAGTFLDYSSIGSKGDIGYASTDFAASLTTDLGIAGVTTAISTAAGAGTTALTLAAAGSVVPGLGTVVGLGVGLGVGWFMGTKTGQKIRDGVQKAVKTVYDGAVNVAKKVGGWVKGLFGK